jgi:hypothetical protein
MKKCTAKPDRATRIYMWYFCGARTDRAIRA